MFDQDFEEALFYLSSVMPHADKLPKPTFFHCVRVALKLYSSGHNKTICIAALLHDTVEDANVNIDEIKNKFGSQVAILVQANTKNYEITDKTEMNKDLIKRVVENGEDAAIIKAADITDNLRYFKKINDQPAIEKLTNMGNRLLELKPVSYNDKIFDEVKLELTNPG